MPLRAAEWSRLRHELELELVLELELELELEVMGLPRLLVPLQEA